MIQINFARKNYRLIVKIQTGLASAAVLLVIASALIVWTGLRLRSERTALDKNIKELQATEEKVRPLLAERDRVIHDLKAMSGLTEARRFSWTRLFTDLESVFPVGVALDHVEFNPREHLLSLAGVAHSPESLRNLIVGLERSVSFKDAYLKHQSVDKGSISFNVVATYQEHKAAGMGEGK